MSAFYLLSAPVRAFFALWALLLCLSDIGSAVLTVVRKRYRFTVPALMLLAPVYFLWQVVFDLSLSGGTESAAEISRALSGFSWIGWFTVFVMLTLASVLLFGYNIRYDKTFITPGTIKQYLDKLPCGVCCWRDNGRVLFSNVCMNRLCTDVTGSPLLNGNHFRDAVKDGIMTVDGRVWRFSCREMLLDGVPLQEMIASDITTEYAKTRALEESKAELSRLNRELQEYYLGIDDAVRRQEILQAKVNIHDEMNRLMLSTTTANREDTAALDRIFSLWEQNTLLLCMEAGEAADAKAVNSLERLAEALNIRLVWQDALPNVLSERQRSLFFSAAQEAIVNAVKHADAKTMTLSFADTGEGLCCRFTNDGKTPGDAVRFTGGLANLSLLADKQGATVSVQPDKPFALLLCFPNKTERPA